MMDYQEFIERKRHSDSNYGIETNWIPEGMFDFQKYGAEYSKRLDIECKGLPDILRAESLLVHKPTRDEIRQIISEYTPKVKALKQKLKP